MSKKIVFLILLATFSSTVFAADTLRPQQLSNVATGWGGEGLYLSFVNGVTVEGCQSPRVIILSNNPMFAEITSIALSALHSNKAVGVRVTGCRNNTMIGTAITIYK